MSDKPLTLAQLQALNKTQLLELAASLQLTVTKSATKQQLIDAITSTPQATAAAGSKAEKSDEAASVVQVQSPSREDASHSVNLLKLQIQLRALELEAEQRRLAHEAEQRKLEVESLERIAQREHELALQRLRAEVTGTTSPMFVPSTATQFRIESATKLLPKLTSEYLIDEYIQTFEKIATLQNWPKTHWPSILQTQLKGKAMLAFAELSAPIMMYSRQHYCLHMNYPHMSIVRDFVHFLS